MEEIDSIIDREMEIWERIPCSAPSTYISGIGGPREASKYRIQSLSLKRRIRPLTLEPVLSLPENDDGLVKYSEVMNRLGTRFKERFQYPKN